MPAVVIAESQLKELPHLPKGTSCRVPFKYMHPHFNRWVLSGSKNHETDVLLEVVSDQEFARLQVVRERQFVNKVQKDKRTRTKKSKRAAGNGRMRAK